MRDTLKRCMLILISCVSVGIISSNAHAVVVNFDDLVPVYDPDFPCFCDNPLTDQYADKGLLISNAYLNGESNDGGQTYQNFLLSGPYTQLNFTGTLPTFVSMLVTSAHDDAVFLTAYGPSGFTKLVQTPGWAGSDDDPLPVSNYLVSFSSATGIDTINIDCYYFLRTGASIDDITFTYSSLPEPSSIGLLALGLLALLRRKFSSR